MKTPETELSTQLIDMQVLTAKVIDEGVLEETHMQEEKESTGKFKPCSE